MGKYSDRLLSAPAPTDAEGSRPSAAYSERLLGATAQETRQPAGVLYETPSGRAPMVQPEIYDTPNPPSFGDAFKAGQILNPKSRIRFLAERRFPGLQPREAIQRYGEIGGDLVYVGDDGKIYREFPGFSSIGGAAASTGRFLGGAGLPALGGTAGGILGGPAGAAVGASAGQAGNRLMAAAEGDPSQGFGGEAFDLGVEAMLNAVGWKAGELLGGKVIDRRLARDAGRYDRKAALALQQTARERFGIDLTAGEASNLGSLINDQVRLGRGFDEAGDVIRDFLTRRAGQVDDAITRQIGRPPPADTVGRRARDVMATAVDDAQVARSSGSSPLYRGTVRRDILVDEKGMEPLLADDYLRSVFDRVSTDPRYGVVDDPINSTSKIDAVKKAIDDEIGKLNRQGESNAVRILSEKRNRLVQYADEAIPGYAEARGAFAAMSPETEAVEQGLEGTIAGLKDSTLRTAAARLIDAKNVAPGDVAHARRLFLSQGKEADWDNVVRSYLRDIWQSQRDNMGDNFTDGAKFRQRVFGTKGQRENMREALGVERFKDFEALMDVLEATARAPGGQSMTQPAAEAAKREAIEAAPIASATKGFGLSLRDWYIDAQADKWRSDLARVMTNPDSLRELEKLRKLKGLTPTSQKAIDITTTALTKAGVYGPASYLAPSQPAPPALRTQGQAGAPQ